MKKVISIILAVVMLFSMSVTAFAADNNVNAQFDIVVTDDAYAAAKNIYENLTVEQKEVFILQIEMLALNGDTSLVEFHQTYVDSNYQYDNAGTYAVLPNAVNATSAASVAQQLQALDLPSVVYYGLLAFSASLGVPVGNVVDLVVGLGLGVIILANWDAIANVWDDIVDIFVDAFGSIVTDAFEYIEGLISGTQHLDADDVDWEAGDKNHIMRGSKDGHVEGFKKLGFDPKDPNNWSKLLPFLKETVENAERTDGPKTIDTGTLMYYFKTFVDKGVEICVKIFFPKGGGTPEISDAWPVY